MKDLNKEKGSVLSVIAQQARLGDITEASLNDSVSRFKRFVNDFKQENKINYDLDESKSTAKRKRDCPVSDRPTREVGKYNKGIPR